jgi:transposase
MKKQRYTAEFKKEAAKMMIIDGVTVKEASDQLGVPAGVLYTWKHKYLDEMEANNSGGSVSPKALAAENAELRKQLAKAKRMNAILKKTVGYFSTEE